MAKDNSILSYEHIIWDWNGTLLNDVDVCLQVINNILKKRSLPILSYERYREVFEFPVANYYNKLGFDYNVDTFEKIADEYIADFDQRYNETTLHDGAKEVLEKLETKGISQSVLSASKTESLHTFINHFGIADYFIKIIGLDNHYAESKVENGKKWIKELGVDPKKVLMIGDTTHDYEVAYSIGINCILVAGGHQSIERLKECGVKVYESLNQLLDI